MSEIKALEEMRELGEKVKNSCFTGVHCDAVIRLTDAIEAEIADRFVELPVDADGMMLEIGDKLEYRDETMTLCGLIWDGADWYATNVFESTSWKPVRRCHHVKPRTLEDVIYDIAINSVEISRYIEGVPVLGIDADALSDGVEEHMDEIRGLLGGGAR